MQIIENWAEIEGQVIAISPHPTLAEYSLVKVQVLEVSSVNGFRNLFLAAKGQTLEIAVPKDNSTSKLNVGMIIRWRIRKAGPDAAFASLESVAKL